MQIYGLLVLIFTLLVAIFAVQNATPVDIYFLSWKFSQVSLVLVIFISALAGALVMAFLGMLHRLNARKAAKGVSAREAHAEQDSGKLPGT